jgi:aspartate racemase
LKTIGIVGGTGPATTVDYYQRIIALYRRKSGDNFPSMLINSVNARPMIASLNAGQFGNVTEIMVGALEKLARGGADFAAIAANTPHIVFDDIRPRSPLPVISIVESAAERAEELGMKKLGLLGTKFTMEGTFYHKVFSQREVELVVPEADERAYCHEKYMGELFYNIIREDTRNELTGMVSNMADRDGIEGVILGGTELSLIFREPEIAGLPVLDTAQIHVESIVREALG